ncbi:MAG: alanine--tRNA ligase-related protein, partial [bacterium]
RAVYFGQRQLGIEEPLMASLAETAIEVMSAHYEELERQRQFVLGIVAPEERRFEETLERGSEMLEGMLAARASNGKVSGGDAFLLHDTYGFPLELTREVAAQHGLSVDEAGFEAEMQRQRERARAAAGGADAVAAEARYAGLAKDATVFRGYDGLDIETRVVAVIDETAENVEVLLAETPFYPEGGGQVGDRGEIAGVDGRVVVEDTRRVAERLIVHRGRVVEGRIAAGDEVTARVDARHRADTMRNHTATHLLHAALRKVLGTHVRQAGSLVARERLRFDFTHTEAVTPEQLMEVERLVNEKVRENLEVRTRMTTFDEAMAEGVLAFFGEKYGDEVRVV